MPHLTAKQVLSDPSLNLISEVRPLQVGLTEFVETCIGTDTPAVIEAGTGIGKSYAYLVPAVLEATRGPLKRRVVVSTGMKSLQAQLFFKDLPRVAEVLGPHISKPLTFARRVGKANYGCQRQVENNVGNIDDLAIYNRFFDEVPDWIWGDAPDHIKLPEYHTMFSVGHCNGERCDFYDKCVKQGYLKAKAAYEDADVVVVNHALIGADLRVRQQHDVDFLPEFHTLIVDEAHKFPEDVRSALTCDMPEKFLESTQKKYKSLVNVLRGDASYLARNTGVLSLPHEIPLIVELTTAYSDMFQEARVRKALGARATQFATTARRVATALERQVGIGTEPFKAFLRGGRKGEEQDNDCEERYALPFSVAIRRIAPAMEILYFLDALVSKILDFANAIDLSTKERLKYAVHVETRGDRTKIAVIPLDITRPLLAHFEQREITPLYLSATLAIEKDFTRFAKEVGVDPKSSFYAGTPFNFEKQGVAYYPRNIPLPPSTREDIGGFMQYQKAVAAECYDLLMANEGHAFILFTAISDMRAVHDELENLGYPYPMLLQSEALKGRARDIFMATPHATLLGTKTYWEGIDIPGLQLSLVIIPKLPFPMRSDPVIEAKCTIAGDSWFQQVFLPGMLVDLRQMAGRGIRTLTDLCVVAVLDPRVHTKNYGNQAMRAVGYPRWDERKERILGTLAGVTKRRKSLALPKEGT